MPHAGDRGYLHERPHSILTRLPTEENELNTVLMTMCLAMSLSAVTPPAHAGNPRFEAFVLAIEHFDSDHEIGLAPDGLETRFVHMALERAREDVPQLAEIHLRTEGLRAGRSQPDRYRALEVKSGRGLRRGSS